ncbi:MAG: hypothetical protein HQM10_09475 [Candidatus Riflebacteria bacterium]|nr:hypothetical protein [Candidatus Riflebacteria bacterium]
MFSLMELDWQTQRDLELFQGSAAEQSIFEVLDRTRTTDGKRVLQKRFKNPLYTVSLIRETQNVVSFLSSAVPNVTFPFSQSDLDNFQQYLDSTYLVITPAEGFFGNFAEKLSSIRDKEFTNFIRQKPYFALEFLMKAGTFYDLLDLESCPEMLRKDIQFFRTIVGFGGFNELLIDPVSNKFQIHDGIKLDNLFRKDLKKSLFHLLERLIELDGLLSMAKISHERGFVMPEFIEANGPFVELHGVYHLFVESPIRNDFEVKEGKNILFLTGPNMAGKTTYMKAVAISLLLAHIGMGVPAIKMRLTLFTRFFCSLNAMDNIREGVSSFFSEIRRVKQILEAALNEDQMFAIFDELFKGTNVKDALDCSNVVINGLAGFSRHAFMVSSHLLELHDLLSDSHRIDFFHFNGEVLEEKISFDYRLKPGVCSQRLGFQILQQEGILKLLGGDNIIQSAKGL